jgi:cell division protein FtsB
VKTVAVIIAVFLVAVLVVVALLAVVAARWGRRSYQRYSGLERQRAAAKQARVAGADRLQDAEQHLIEAQRLLAGRGVYQQAQAIEHLRIRLSAMADRHLHATYGYAPLGSPNPVREAELADLQQRDADAIGDAQAIAELAETVRDTARAGDTPDLRPLQGALDDFEVTLNRRKAAT